jgi:type III secretory pathway component EscS
MRSIFTADIFLPIALLLLQALFFFFLGLVLLKRFRIIKQPLAGLEYSNVVVAGAVLFGVFYITTADIQGVFQSYKTYQNLQGKLWANCLSTFSQYFLVVLFLELLYGIIAAGIVRVLLGFKSSVKEIQEGNVPGSVLMAVLIVCAAILLQRVGEEIMIFLTPQFVNFR